jgi:inositol 1,4,5-triphosphate receptor type 3
VGYFTYGILFFLKCLKSLFVLLQDFDILYYTCYIGAGIMGLVVHPFLFVILMMDILKLDQLKTVILAMYQPRYELALAFILMFIIQYYFTFISWMYIYQDYEDLFDLDTPRNCDAFWKCFVVTIDWTFKFTGSIGAHLVDPETIALEEL